MDKRELARRAREASRRDFERKVASIVALDLIAALKAGAKVAGILRDKAEEDGLIGRAGSLLDTSIILSTMAGLLAKRVGERTKE